VDKTATGRPRVVAGHLPKGGFAISRADVAEFMLEEAVTPRYVRQVVGLTDYSGDPLPARISWRERLSEFF